MSPSYLRANPSSRSGALGSRRLYWTVVFLFWAVLIAIPVVDNLGVAWILLEATTAASAMLVAFSGKRSAIEAGWKYLVLTSLGLAFALFGIVILCVQVAADGGGAAELDWEDLAARAPGLHNAAVAAAFVMILAGLATKGGWAPVHNWLPDAHSEAPPPVSALLSAALLPTVALVAWRLAIALAPAVGEDNVQILFIGFGVASLAVAVPFLWRPLPWKRLLAYSSLEHMGVIVLAIGIDHPIATAGALLHVAGHGIAKSLGFSAADPAPALPARRLPPATARPCPSRPRVGGRRGRQPRGARGSSALAAVRQRGPRARRRLRCRARVGGGGRGDASRPRDSWGWPTRWWRVSAGAPQDAGRWAPAACGRSWWSRARPPCCCSH